MVEFRVERASGLPAYLQLTRQVREALRLGWLTPGDRLPTVREVVTSSGVNANTVLKAYRELEFAGLVEMRQGSGTFVTDGVAAIEPELMSDLRERLAEWAGRARAAGLANDDMEALLRTVLSMESEEAA